jgi:hypothetical protein
MPDVNAIILKKLEACDEDVQKLALAAIEAAEKLHEERSVEEQLQSAVRKIVKQRGK